MKINNSQGINQINPYKNQINQRAEQSAPDKAKKQDVVAISQEAFKLQGDNRTDKVESLKAQIDAGQYKVNHKAVAEKMIAFWQKAGGRE